MKIAMPWNSALLKNQAYPMGDTKLGHTKACKGAMNDIFWLIKQVSPGKYKWNGGRIKATINAYVANVTIDAQNLVDAVSDALEVALSVDDKHFDIAPYRFIDRGNPRIEIIIEQEVKDNESGSNGND